MYLSKIKLWNFRKFGSTTDLIVNKKLRKADLNINFNNRLNVLIGENDSGKTAIIDAIKLVLKTHSYDWIRLDQDDFYNNSARLRIECRFDDLTPEEAKNFTEWLGIEGEGEEAKVYLKVILEAQRNNDRIMPFDIKAGADDDGYALTAEAKDYLKTTYLKPLRDSKGELVPRKNSRLSQILQGHEVFKGKNDDHELVKDVYGKFCEEVESYFSSGGGKEINTLLDSFLRDFFGESKSSRITITEQKLRNILDTLKLTLEDGKLGLGSHNLLFIASELLNLKRTNWDGIRLGLIEELEAHLHPQAQMRVVESLQQEKNLQFILTTHSPNLLSKIKLENLIMCSDNSEEEHCTFSMGKNYTELEGNDYKFLEKFLDVTKSNLFFAKGVVLVEGWSEEILIPALALKIKMNLTEKGVSIINVGGTAFLRYSKIFLRKSRPHMNIPISIVTDNDIYSNMDTDKKSRQESKNTTLKETEDQSVKVFMGEHWTLEWALFKSSSLSMSFKNVVREVHSGTSEFASDDDFETKLSEKIKNKSLKKSEIAYRFAQVLMEDDLKDSPEIVIQEDDEHIKYLINAIKYVAK